MSYPKNQLKGSTTRGEGPTSKVSEKSQHAKGPDTCSEGKTTGIDARHTAAWMNGAKLTIRNYD